MESWKCMGSQNPVAIVTGSSRGIGAETAKLLGQHDVDVVVNFKESRSEGLELVEEIEQLGSRAVALKADVADPNEVSQLVSEAHSEFGRIDYLVNNAGAILRPGHWEEINEETWRKTLDINLKGVFNCTRTVAPYLEENGSGKIVNVSSTYAMMGAAPVIAYSAANAGVLSLTRSFAKELAPKVTVNTVAFGNIDTDMTASAGEEFIEQTIDATPLGRLGSPEEAASAIKSLLLTEASNFITGETLVVDGGHRLN